MQNNELYVYYFRERKRDYYFNINYIYKNYKYYFSYILLNLIADH